MSDSYQPFLTKPRRYDVMPFGKHRGRPLDEISRPYLGNVLSFPELDPALGDAIRQELCRRGLGFGKFKDVALDEVPEQYLRWLLGTNFLVPPWDDLAKEELGRRGVCN